MIWNFTVEEPQLSTSTFMTLRSLALSQPPSETQLPSFSTLNQSYLDLELLIGASAAQPKVMGIEELGVRR
ncbi:MAG: hypothetical protein Kow00109_27910 [Acidobacteriota bacterium]